MESHNGLPGVSRNTAIVKEEPNEIIVVDPLGSIDFTDSELNLSSAVENELAVTYVEGRARRVISSEVDIKIEPGMLSTVEDPEAAYSSHSFELDSDSNILDDGESDVNSCTEGVLTSDQVELMMKREPHSNLKVPTSAASSLRKQLVSMSQSNSSIGENPSFLRKGLKRHSGPGAQSFSLSNSEAASRPRIRFTDEDDLFLLKEVAAENPFEDGSKWKVVADKMKGKFSKAFTPRNLRERINHLLQRYNLHFEEWMVARNKDEATLERITLLQETRDMKQEFRGKRLKKSEQVASQTGKMLRDEAAKNHASTSQHVRDEMVETTVVPTDAEFILDYPNGDTIEINDVNSPSQTSTSTPPSAPNSGNLPSEPGPPLPPLCLITRSLPTPSPLSGALVENSPSPNQMNDDPGILSNAAPSTARLLKRKRGMNASVDSFMAKKQHMSSFYLKRRQLELEERKFEEEVTRKRMELELEEKKYNLQLRMFEQQVKKEGETLRFISDLMARQEARDTTLLHLIGKVLKVVEELVKK